MARYGPLSLLGLFARISYAHFLITTPPALGSNIENEDVAPCGGFLPSSSDNLTDFHVGGDAIGVETLHAQCFFSYRGMLGTAASSGNWTVLLPTIEEFGLNDFCEPSVAAPAAWAGSSGLLQVIQDAEDGIHFQCMAVNFVAGVGTPNSATCSNSSGVSATFSDDPNLATAGSGSPTASITSSSATVAASAAATTTKSAAAGTYEGRPAACGILLAGLVAVFTGPGYLYS